jgi:hypothetical protein
MISIESVRSLFTVGLAVLKTSLKKKTHERSEAGSAISLAAVFNAAGSLCASCLDAHARDNKFESF